MAPKGTNGIGEREDVAPAGAHGSTDANLRLVVTARRVAQEQARVGASSRGAPHLLRRSAKTTDL